jgi:CBS domain-containing protein
MPRVTRGTSLHAFYFAFALFCGAELAYLFELRFETGEPLFVFSIGLGWELTLNKLMKDSWITKVDSKELMKDLTSNDCIKSDITLEKAQEHMRKIGVDRIPVLDDQDKMVGLITDGEIKRAIKNLNEEKFITEKVLNKMIPVNNIAKVFEGDNISQAIEIMKNKEIEIDDRISRGVHGMPVITREGKIKGMVKLDELLELDKSRW